MDDLVQRIRAVLDATERDAKARRGIWPYPGVSQGVALWLHLHHNGNAIVTSYLPGEAGYGDAARLREWCEPEGEGWSRERVLRLVAAHRKVLEAWESNRRQIEAQQAKWLALMNSPAGVTFEEQAERNRVGGHLERLHGRREAFELVLQSFADSYKTEGADFE